MNLNLLPLRNCIALLSAVLYSIPSFSQHSRPYYPNAHDTGGNYRPELIKQNYFYFGFLSLLNQHISVEYDRQMSDDIMIAGTVGIINSGLSQETSNSSVGGVFVEGGVKLMLNPDYRRNGNRGYFAEEGLYLKPQVVLSIFNTLVTNTTYSPYVSPPPVTSNQYSYTGGAIILNLGAEWMVANTILIDIYGGVGVSFSNGAISGGPSVYNYYSYLTIGSTFPLAFSGGVNIGLPFK